MQLHTWMRFEDLGERYPVSVSKIIAAIGVDTTENGSFTSTAKIECLPDEQSWSGDEYKVGRNIVANLGSGGALVHGNGQTSRRVAVEVRCNQAGVTGVRTCRTGATPVWDPPPHF